MNTDTNKPHINKYQKPEPTAAEENLLQAVREMIGIAVERRMRELLDHIDEKFEEATDYTDREISNINVDDIIAKEVERLLDDKVDDKIASAMSNYLDDHKKAIAAIAMDRLTTIIMEA